MILRSLILKEWKLVSRDWHALGVLFIMPAIFLLIMSVALAGLNEEQAPTVAMQLVIPEADQDTAFFRTALAATLPAGRFVAQDDARLPTLRLPANFSAALLDTDLTVELIFPATSDRIDRQRIRAAIELALAQTRLQAFLSETGNLDVQTPLNERLATVQQYTQVQINEHDRLLGGQLSSQPGSSQHSVAAWIIFGMFFIMLPMANGFLQEQRSGVLARMQSLGLAPWLLLLSKLLPYALINLLQFVSLLLLGFLVLPVLGVQPLMPGGSLLAWLLLVSVLVLATCSLGLAIAGIVRTTEQALLLSAGLNLILAALGGIMVPRSVMPEIMQQLSLMSPMRWTLEAFTLLLAGQGGVMDVLPWCAYLLLFALATGGLGLLLFQRRLKVNRWSTMN